MLPYKIRVFLPGGGYFTAGRQQSAFKSPGRISYASPNSTIYYVWDPDTIEKKIKFPLSLLGPWL